MAENVLNIAESSQEIQIDKEKLRFICSKVNIWDHFRISKSEYVSLNSDEKLKMVKEFCKSLLPVYFSNGKRQFCCNDCVWFEDIKQDCLKCGVNVMACTCFEFSDDKKVLSSVNNLKNIVSAVEHFDKQQKELFDRENGVRYCIDYHRMKLIGYQGQNKSDYCLGSPAIDCGISSAVPDS